MTIDNILSYWNILTTVVTLASMVAAITPTKKDDNIMAKVNKFISLAALNVGNAKKG